MNPLDFLPKLPLLPDALCRKIENANIFFPESRAEERKTLPFVKEFCGKCIERKECLEYALNEEIPFGIWGGKTPKERGLILKGRRKGTFGINRAEKIRALSKLGHKPKEIALMMRVETAYVTQVLKRSTNAKLEGEIQSQPQTNDSSEESQSLLEQR
jgi:WhiB family redox-sensing transcriptional regulator